MTYNDLRDKQEWLPELENLQTKYPKFCFKNIHPYSTNYYMNKKDAQNAYNICNEKNSNIIGKYIYKRYTSQKKLEKICELDKKIPPIDFNLYYEKE